MARYNEILVGRYNRAVQKHFQMKGSASLAQLDDTLAMTIPFFWGAESRYLESWFRYGNAITAAAVAAQTTNIKFRNPAGSNVIVVVEKLTIFEGAADTITLSNQNADTDLTGPTGGNPFDIRSKATSTLKISTGNGVAVGAGLARAFLQANIPLEFIITDFEEFPILPGDSLLLITTSVNVAFQASMIWRERFLEEAERA